MLNTIENLERELVVKIVWSLEEENDVIKASRENDATDVVILRIY